MQRSCCPLQRRGERETGRTTSASVQWNRWAMLWRTVKKAQITQKVVVLVLLHWENGLCVFPLKPSSVEWAVPCQPVDPLTAVWSLINTAPTWSSETGAASHTPCCKIMSLQRDGIKYMGRGRHFQSLSPSWIFKWNEERGRRCDLLDSPQKERDKEIHFPLYVHAFTCHPPARTIRRGADPFAYGFYKYEDLYLLLSRLQSGPSTDKPYWSYGNSNTAGVSANSDGLIKLAEASYIIE